MVTNINLGLIQAPDEIFRQHVLQTLATINTTVTNTTTQVVTNTQAIASPQIVSTTFDPTWLNTQVNNLNYNLGLLTTTVKGMTTNTGNLSFNIIRNTNNINAVVNMLPSLVYYPPSILPRLNYENRLQYLEVMKTFNPKQSTIPLLNYTVDTLSATYTQAEVQNLANKIESISNKIDSILGALQKALIIN